MMVLEPWMDIFPDLVGGLGALLAVGAYAWKEIQFGFGDTLAYSLMNIVGSSLIVISLFFDWNLGAMMQEVAWVSIGIVGVFGFLKRKKEKKEL